MTDTTVQVTEGDDEQDDGDCAGCGGSLHDRQKHAATCPEENLPTYLMHCKFCGGAKCCMCDMGDDVGCIACDADDPD